jgi:hypothetical protein
MCLRSKTLVNALTGLYLVDCNVRTPRYGQGASQTNSRTSFRAGKDMHSPNKKVCQEAAEVLAVTPRKSRSKTPRK